MTQISGKKYQMKNAAGTENRFPYTVMDAVYGLNSYLQDQFSALADIYMPIEGITESKTGQEFAYRKSPATIKAKSLTLDRIYGKTLAWNQLVPNGNFADGLTGWQAYRATASISDGVVTVTPTVVDNTAGYACPETLEQKWIEGHKYLIIARVKAKSGNAISFSGYYGGLPGVTIYRASGSWQSISDIITANTAIANYSNLRVAITQGADAELIPYQVKCLMVLDLTKMFGAGKEPSTVAEFEALYPGYHDFGNKLISNDADSLETVGFNQWDEEWESGIWNPDTGEAGAGYQKIRSKNFIPVFPSTAYYYRESGVSSNVNILCYDADKNYIGGSTGFFANINNFTTPANCRYIKFYNDAGYGSTYNHDICINLSDPAKNGTYEPYRKTTLQLGLNNFKVKSHNIWDEEWELGTYSNGIKIASPDRIRCKNPIPCLPSTVYKETVVGEKSNATFNFTFFDDNGNVISGLQVTNTTFETPSNCHYFVFATTTSYYGTTYNNDICINLSSSFNGQYEPHWDITITGGLKGDGDWADILYSNNHLTNKAKRVNLGDLDWTYSNGTFVSTEIPGIKAGVSGVVPNLICAKYSSAPYNSIADKQISVSSGKKIWIVDSGAGTDAVAFKTAINGTYADYELATPIEYVLVEPLIYSMAAGTTEARISPNSDGLSAPFCCDMTYDANANNDSANAQYAATAGRLYNTHKLWGRDFDGSNDVSGALSGVTTIEASGNITTVAQLISTVATGTAPLSVASTTEVANLHSYTATKLHTQRTLWGQNFDGSGNVTGDMSSVGNIAFSASGKNIASLLYFDTTNSRVGVGASSPAYKLDVNGTLNASGAATLGSTLTVADTITLSGNTAIKKRIYFGDIDHFLELDGNGFHFSHGVYSNSFIVAGGLGNSEVDYIRTVDFDLGTSLIPNNAAALYCSGMIYDAESDYLFVSNPACMFDNAIKSQVVSAISGISSANNIAWVGMAVDTAFTTAGTMDSTAIALVVATSSNTFYWVEFEI